MKKQIIFINGPAGSGKDTLANGLIRRFCYAKNYKFAAALKAATFALYGIEPKSLAQMLEIAEDRYYKEHPQQLFMGKTPREALIELSEAMIKPVLGNDFFGKVLAHKIASHLHVHTALISDSGFESEAHPIIQRFGVDNCLLIRLHREGCTFEGDSRSYIDLPIPNVDLHNNGTFVELFDAAEFTIRKFG